VHRPAIAGSDVVERVARGHREVSGHSAVLGLGNPAPVSELAAAAFTVMAFEVPVIVAFPVSVAVIVWLPRVFKWPGTYRSRWSEWYSPATPA